MCSFHLSRFYYFLKPYLLRHYFKVITSIIFYTAVIRVVIYADILIIVNFLVDYFLFLTSGYIIKSKAKTWRYILGAFIGGISSIYIFLPVYNAFFDLAAKFLICGICSAVMFGIKSFKNYLKSLITVFLVTALFGGVMSVFYRTLKPKGMMVKNSVVYFNISPLVLIGLTVVFYFLFLFLSLIFKPAAVKSEKCNIELSADGNKTIFTAIIDSGNSLNDVFGKSDIIIADNSVAVALFGDIDVEHNINLKNRYRAIPCGTVSGCDMLNGYRCDIAHIKSSDSMVVLEKPILAISKLPLTDGYEGIVNPEIFV